MSDPRMTVADLSGDVERAEARWRMVEEADAAWRRWRSRPWPVRWLTPEPDVFSGWRMKWWEDHQIARHFAKDRGEEGR